MGRRKKNLKTKRNLGLIFATYIVVISAFSITAGIIYKSNDEEEEEYKAEANAPLQLINQETIFVSEETEVETPYDFANSPGSSINSEINSQSFITDSFKFTINDIRVDRTTYIIDLTVENLTKEKITFTGSKEFRLSKELDSDRSIFYEPDFTYFNLPDNTSIAGVELDVKESKRGFLTRKVEDNPSSLFMEFYNTKTTFLTVATRIQIK